ncbi:uncharacterized protein Tco025E_06150 [Trypanosoma conorhini]|uniref:C3H1-type domain-containing protein n=1 Tax=Trypanosoma conorhini TaxID=83891 RepID=A0A3R7KQY7_9TRYP|nr:uncharacterized protein Tco025E_06150 [Trypanosoma conorhini]RNF13602.1 hypothetical protein Tco025E_06150 [Trypanosoma conorhini]
MSGGKSPLFGSSRRLRLFRKPTGEEEWAYSHNPYEYSASNTDWIQQRTLNPCRHYAEGRCNRGSSCRFFHELRHTVIVTPHTTPKQPTFTPLTGTTPLSAGALALGGKSPPASVGSINGRQSHASSAVEPSASAGPTEASARQPSSGSAGDSGYHIKGTLPLSNSNLDTPQLHATLSTDSLVVSPLQKGDTNLQGSFPPVTLQTVSQQR